MFMKKQLSIFLLLAFFCLFIFNSPAECQEDGKGKLEVHFLSVLEGESTFIKTPGGKAVLIDGGGVEDGNRIINHLKSLGISQLDLIIATHPHSQNIGGLTKIIEDLPVKKIVDSGIPYASETFEKYLKVIEAKKVDLEFVRDKLVLPLDSEVELRFLSPPPYIANDVDNSSIVCQLVYGRNSFLFTGDIDSSQGGKLKIPATFLKVPRRGEINSLSESFLAGVKPKEAIVFNQGKGSNETVSILKAQGVKTHFISAQTRLTIIADKASYKTVVNSAQKSILISLSQHTLYLHCNGEIYKQYRIAVGKSSTPTPRGEFSIINKKMNPGGPFGVRWMGFHPNPWPSYGIHGTNAPSSIGKSVSHGCIRLHNEDVKELYSLVNIGTPVTIVK